ncbi:MAG: hypothetical protein HRT86_14750 [Ilumatobacteraceae bacterium]|nr:hypothetical protein [Ilumatobacteraceae bacterium]
MVKFLVFVALVTALLSWGIFGFVDLYAVAAVSLGSIVAAIVVGLSMGGTQVTVYGIFLQKDTSDFIVARMKPKEKVTREDRSYMIESVISQGGIPIDSIGMFFLNRGYLKFGLKFNIVPGPISEAYRKEREDNDTGTLKKSMDEFKKGL